MKIKLNSSAMLTSNIVLLITALSVALITGLWYAYSCSVNLGLGKLPDREYLMGMQSINREILNPVFFATFMGTLLLLPVCTWLNYGHPRFIFLLAASAIYVIGVFGVTIGGNVPLNNALDAFNIHSSSAQDMITQRLNFEQPWNKLHQIRTIASLICLILVLVACINNAPAASKG
ncbi:MAG TPA: anthrone oxygenase family protein [Pedobacter sp.]|uniref:anthrone oxygenase family protein n=1 Tax=Pedobacter sp. TaxID=1411316 RepID=UPI002B7E32DD|nr:anthrone oxygenase family protein [Pedobacter sp.]HMI02829.1 anthrone oxygenase family protein [Pedobacter sp.]